MDYQWNRIAHTHNHDLYFERGWSSGILRGNFHSHKSWHSNDNGQLWRRHNARCQLLHSDSHSGEPRPDYDRGRMLPSISHDRISDSLHCNRNRLERGQYCQPANRHGGIRDEWNRDIQ